MFKYILLILGILCSVSHAQIISQFDFDSNPVTHATVGPDASSISSSATSSSGGVGGTNGLNAGLPKMDINMVIPGSPTFDVNGIDVSFDFQRDENAGMFFERGQSLRMNGISNLSIQYRVEDGMGGYNTVSSGNIYSVPNDNTFRNYRFIYTPCDGIGMVMVDNVIIWMNDGPDNRNMYWTGAGDVEFGRGMDGTGYNRTMVDNLIVGEVNCSPLPVEFITINATPTEYRSIDIEWSTASELNCSHFIVERMNSHQKWDSLGITKGSGTSNTANHYLFTDQQPISGTSYYRVRQVDYDGDTSYSPIFSVQLLKNELVAIPNPSSGYFIIHIPNSQTSNTSSPINVYNQVGEMVLQKHIDKKNQVSIDLSHLPSGIYMLEYSGKVIRLMKK